METRMEKHKLYRKLIEIENELDKLINRDKETEEEFQNETYVETLHIKGKDVEVWNDDYGQCFFLKWVDENGNEKEESCGTYNLEYEEYARMLFDEDYKFSEMRKIGIILATDREYMCRQIAKMIASKELPIEIYDKYLYDMPFIGRDEKDTFDMIYGTWGK